MRNKRINTMKYNFNKNIVISKLPSHVTLPTRGNEIADDLAKEAVETAVLNSLSFNPCFSWENSKTARRNFGCCELTEQWDLVDSG